MGSTAYKSRVVNIGNLPLGGGYPVRIQSMTSTNTMDTTATVEQSIRMIEAGCEYVRITAPGIREAENLFEIRKELRARGYLTPLIADIHYQPRAAEVAARHVEKIRINPGNYVDRKRGRMSYTDTEYKAELDRIRERLRPLIQICRDHGTAMRIGSNHGSLSERILHRYGDTPEGMVESALEFAVICRELDYHDIILSMKSSNVKVMVQANRLLVKRMLDLGMDFPIHLGVTEAGDAEDGRIKSAAGIGPLLADGIGDTIRVSLTEDPEFEIPVAKAIIDAVKPDGEGGRRFLSGGFGVDPFRYSRRETANLRPPGLKNTPVVVTDRIDGPAGGERFKPGFTPDLVETEEGTLRPYGFPGAPQDQALIPVFIRDREDLATALRAVSDENILVFEPGSGEQVSETRDWFRLLSSAGSGNPVILRMVYEGLSHDKMLIRASIDFASLLIDGFSEGIWIRNRNADAADIAYLSYGILQATGERISKTEYIACPSCGRTLFNIQSTLQVIKQRTSHLKGLKIGVMGCCVNGPGEMADAHYGYVGGAKGKITLYKGRQIMKTGIREEHAVDELIRLIKDHGDWK